MSEVDCAQMMIKLRHFDAWQKRRTEIAEYYTENLMQFLDPILPPPDVESSWHKYVIRVGDRSKFQSYLQARGISTKVHYPIPLPSIDLAFKFKFDNQEVFPLAETHSKESVSLPIYPEMADNEVEYIVSVVKDYYKKD
jgi:dTDP-4-amino-4,6-dideoxygalactose transaminase